ncbi:protein of unknown function [Burkholderia multivorans]
MDRREKPRSFSDCITESAIVAESRAESRGSFAFSDGFPARFSRHPSCAPGVVRVGGRACTVFRLFPRSVVSRHCRGIAAHAEADAIASRFVRADDIDGPAGVSGAQMGESVGTRTGPSHPGGVCRLTGCGRWSGSVLPN